MAAINQDFVKFKGDDFNLKFTIEDIGSAEGYDASWKLNSNPQVVKTDGSGISITGNEVTVSIGKADTVNLAAGPYTHELQLINNDVGGVAASGTLDLREPLHDRS